MLLKHLNVMPNSHQTCTINIFFITIARICISKTMQYFYHRAPGRVRYFLFISTLPNAWNVDYLLLASDQTFISVIFLFFNVLALLTEQQLPNVCNRFRHGLWIHTYMYVSNLLLLKTTILCPLVVERRQFHENGLILKYKQKFKKICLLLIRWEHSYTFKYSQQHTQISALEFELYLR